MEMIFSNIGKSSCKWVYKYGDIDECISVCNYIGQWLLKYADINGNMYMCQ